ncbi:hypothetical protein [Chromatium okenii]|jgi:hypothetical protein|uniref:ATP-binding protein n=1 Tax=Chromatium okenii TaxID=61644 RepID=A0A2S7XSA4_9GAMM|nr:hypothetical protein [Chromatium okenii]MBV5307945.1 hypothetical protein [Chromatium okenii]PQJ96302.1 hypothetical protein CXB77_11180 [Chromatium okenii]
MNISDILIHITDNLNAQQCAELEQALRQIDGVIAPRFTPEKAHLLTIAFNPDLTNSATLCAQVQSFGYTAQLIGI